MRLLHTMRRVCNFQTSMDFYTKLMNIKINRQSGNSEYQYTMVFIGYGEGAETTMSEPTYNWNKI